MAAPRYPSAEPNYPISSNHVGDHLSIGLDASERIDRVPSRSRSDGAIVAAIGALVVIGGGMALLDDRIRAPLPSKQRTAETRTLADPVAELPVAQMPPVADLGVERPEGPVQPELTDEPGEGTAEPPQRLSPPTVDKEDPYQMKAIAAGLHPGLSRVLLMRLTLEDYANAGIAIRKALAEAMDKDVIIWPRQPAAGLAQFRVHFVRGALNCRRYVVAVSLDRWATTALPFEKCGERLVEPKGR